MSQYRTLTSSPAWLGTDGLSWDSARSGEQQWAVGSGRRGGPPWVYPSARGGGWLAGKTVTCRAPATHTTVDGEVTSEMPPAAGGRGDVNAWLGESWHTRVCIPSLPDIRRRYRSYVCLLGAARSLACTLFSRRALSIFFRILSVFLSKTGSIFSNMTRIQLQIGLYSQIFFIFLLKNR